MYNANRNITTDPSELCVRKNCLQASKYLRERFYIKLLFYSNEGQGVILLFKVSKFSTQYDYPSFVVSSRMWKIIDERRRVFVDTRHENLEFVSRQMSRWTKSAL